MIKLIATDIDGTLLNEGQDNINPEIFEVILKLKEQGIMFAAASGRQYVSMRQLFKPVEQEMIFISENGANVVCRGYEMSFIELNQRNAEDLIHYIRKQPGCYLTVSAGRTMFVEDKDPEFLEILQKSYHNDLTLVDDVLAQNITPIKISIFKKDGVPDIAEKVIAEWSDRFNTVIAGELWIDFMDYEADKGNALKKIQKIMNIRKEETMAFGDNHNDIGMMKSAGESYAVANAQPEVLKAAKHIADTNVNNGVLKVMKKLLV